MSLELNSCVLIDYRLWAAKSEGRQWVEHCIEQCIEHPPEPRSGLCPELLADFRIPKPPGCSQGAQRAVFCAVRVADFLAEGAAGHLRPVPRYACPSPTWASASLGACATTASKRWTASLASPRQRAT